MEELHKLTTRIAHEFPDVIKKIDVGKTYNNNTIHAFVMEIDSGNQTSTNEKPVILIDGLHDARELTSTAMCVYTMLKLLFNYVHNDQ